jgi:hypothetical protein
MRGCDRCRAVARCKIGQKEKTHLEVAVVSSLPVPVDSSSVKLLGVSFCLPCFLDLIFSAVNMRKVALRSSR